VAGVDEAGRGPGGPGGGGGRHPGRSAAHCRAGGLQEAHGCTARGLFDEIRAKALCFCIAEASVEEIDRLNILQATMLAMRAP
jgi:ribonuclease HII